ncbi:hypothetical protein BST11_19405 [Mycobacterium alsense]|uniref:DUF732 domain-containing protein n=1 Tax=Mycobacterium alsense TaxID=324058 RepID=A0ABX3R582_9MYCO|nr:hypothetical protein BST11_19405 [Mycobacterium alsense]
MKGRTAVVVATAGVLLAVVALTVSIISIMRPMAGASGKSSVGTTTSPTIAPDQVAAAKKELCSAYHLAAHSVNVDTHSSDTALARISLANGAGMLDAAAANPALDSNDRDAARALASAYRNSNAVSSDTDLSSPLYQATIDEITRTNAAMAKICP